MAELATFDRQEFARLTARAFREDGRGYRELAGVIGITTSDMSRAANRKPLSFEKVAAIAAWTRFDPYTLYSGPNEINVLQSMPRETQELPPC